MNVKQVLEGAKAIIEQGWAQHHLTDGHGSYCLKSAIGMAAGVYEDRRGSVGYRSLDLNDLRLDRIAYQLVVDQLPEPFDSIPTYNDHPDTTQNDILAVIEKAIASC